MLAINGKWTLNMCFPGQFLRRKCIQGKNLLDRISFTFVTVTSNFSLSKTDLILSLSQESRSFFFQERISSNKYHFWIALCLNVDRFWKKRASAYSQTQEHTTMWWKEKTFTFRSQQDTSFVWFGQYASNKGLFFFCNGRQGKEVHSYANKVQGREHYAIWFVLFQALFSLAIVAPSDGSEIGSELLDTLLIFTAVFQVSHSSVLPVH